ncbi:MAG: hypothetical protein QOK02_1884 [Mycobacterium sp.]|nr:hypothetical protein [Mycobacterium sp.]
MHVRPKQFVSMHLVSLWHLAIRYANLGLRHIRVPSQSVRTAGNDDVAVEWSRGQTGWGDEAAAPTAACRTQRGSSSKMATPRRERNRSPKLAAGPRVGVRSARIFRVVTLGDTGGKRSKSRTTWDLLIMEPMTGIEPAYSAWEVDSGCLPLSLSVGKS